MNAVGHILTTGKKEWEMAYSELIKNFEKIRAYMREFYIYGFKSRNEYDRKSVRSYDDERRRVESWLGDYMRFAKTNEGKNVFLSVDSRTAKKNPFYKAWKAKSFTDGDITLHFAIFDILCTSDIKLTLSELIDEIDTLLSGGFTYDESTLRKKLREYTAEGIIITEKQGRKVLYSRAPDIDISGLCDVTDFFGEIAPCGVIGSFISDKLPPHDELFTFKHHYITQALDSDIAAVLFDAMQKKSYVTVENLGRHLDKPVSVRLVPLRIYISSQNGRQHLIAYNESLNRLYSYRLDYISDVKIGEPCERFDELRQKLDEAENCMWGVNGRLDKKDTEHVEFEIKVADDEQYIVHRLEREKRCGKVEKIDDNHYRYSADVFDTTEMIPWIRTFICRITRLSFSDRTAENNFKADIEKMYSMYGIEDTDDDPDNSGGESDDIQ